MDRRSRRFTSTGIVRRREKRTGAFPAGNAPVDDHRRVRVRRSVIEHTLVLLRWSVDVVAAHDYHVERAGCVKVAGRGVVEGAAATRGGDRVHAGGAVEGAGR